MFCWTCGKCNLWRLTVVLKNHEWVIINYVKLVSRKWYVGGKNKSKSGWIVYILKEKGLFASNYITLLHFYDPITIFWLLRCGLWSFQFLQFDTQFWSRPALTCPATAVWRGGSGCHFCPVGTPPRPAFYLLYIFYLYTIYLYIFYTFTYLY